MNAVRPVADTMQRTRKPVDPPTTITELLKRFEAGLDEGPSAQRLDGPK